MVQRSYGSPEVLMLEPRELPAVAPGEVRLRTLAAAVNHSDLEIRAGDWPVRRPRPFPYVPGLEAVGEVVEVGPGVDTVRPGQRVVTMMQGLGGVRGERDGGYAEHVTVTADAIAPVPRDLDPLDVAAVGLAGVTAHAGLGRLGELGGRRVAVTGAAGGVGSAGVALAAAAGAEVVAVVSRDGQQDYLRSLGAAEVLVGGAGLAAGSLDAALDVVGGPLFGPLVGALRPGGTLSVVGAVGGGLVSLDPYVLLLVTLTGWSSETLDGPALRAAVRMLTGRLRDGRLRPPARTVLPLAEAARAHVLLGSRGVRGRVLLVP